MASTYKAVVLAKRPTSHIVPGETFKLQTKPIPKKTDLKDGEVLVESKYLSIDPAMRGWLNGLLAHLIVPDTLVFASNN